VADPPRAEECLRLAIDAALVGTSAELVGIMDRVLELTLDYLRTRKQFGRAIGSFQALQHRAVDVWIQKELSRAAVASAVRALDDPAAAARAQSAAASGAKARAAGAALALCKEALQMHGAIGYTDEYDLGLYFNRALTLSAWLGNAADRRRRYGELAEGGAA
jgi:3-oxochol-4-en-24-oyl-CoA dehydrogenase